MIVICEPQLTGMSHEKVNSGFIYGIRLAYPQDTIRFYAEVSCIQGIKNILENDHVIIDNIEYVPIKIYDSYTFRGMVAYYFLFKELFVNILSAGVDKVYFLSTNPIMLYLIKLLTTTTRFHNINCAFVLHGEFENIAFDQYRELAIPEFPVDPLSEKIKSNNPRELLNRLKIEGPKELARKIYVTIKNRLLIKINQLNLAIPTLLKNSFHIKKSMLWNHSSNYHYIVLSPHVLNNARKYIDVNKLNIYDVVMPTVFSPFTSQPINKFVKFAVFGFGDSVTLSKVALLLSEKNIKKMYEIRVIGMDDRGTEGFPNIHCVSPGKQMPRKEMEKYVHDIDMFLSLYGKDRYQLSCSASILEALSYTKPILYLDNDTMNHFNQSHVPIGYRCVTLEEFVEKAVDIIDNYSAYQSELKTFRNNILNLRDEFSINNLAPRIKASFTFDQRPISSL